MTPKSRPPRPAATRQRLASRQDTVLTSFALPRPLHRRVMRAALELNWTAAQLFRVAAEEWLARNEATIARRTEE